jgi:hypothetical protein
MGEVFSQYKPRILWVSTDPTVRFSFSQQSALICRELASRGYDVHYIAGAYHGLPYQKDGYKIYPVPVAGPKVIFGNQAVL